MYESSTHSNLCFIPGKFLLAQDGDKNWFKLYGHVMTDIGYNANQIQPDWFDVVRPTKLPTMKNEYGTDGNAYFGVRQTRFGVQSGMRTPIRRVIYSI